MALSKWDERLLQLAQLVSTWSKDPSTSAGAVLVDDKHRLVSVGFNGFPHRIKDDERLENRDLKYEMIVHAEVNAVLVAARPLAGCELYLYPWLSCSRCTSVMIQSGIRRVVAPMLTTDKVPRWGENLKLANQLYEEAGVEVILVSTSSLSRRLSWGREEYS